MFAIWAEPKATLSQEIFSVFDPIVETNPAFAADAAVQASLFLPSARQVREPAPYERAGWSRGACGILVKN
jgi:hypothetical protein